MYALIAIVDKETEKFIKKLWRELKEHKLTEYGYEVKDRVPHITLADFDCREIDDVIQLLDSNEVLNGVFQIKFHSIGSFFSSTNIYLSPVINQDLINVHNNVHRILKEYISEASLYTVNNWIPHLTIASRIEPEKLEKIYRYCLENFNPIEGKMIGYDVIKVNEDSFECVYQKRFSA